MSLTAGDLMQTDVPTVSPEMSLIDLDRKLIDERVDGFAVVEAGRLVGVVTRSDIVRQLAVEQSVAEMVSDWYRQDAGLQGNAEASLKEIGDQVGERIEHLHVRDLMIHEPVTVSRDTDVTAVARLLVEKRLLRVLVTESGRLVGVVSARDLLRLIAEGRMTPN